MVNIRGTIQYVGTSNCERMKGKIWNAKAIDYSAGLDITDLVTGKMYAEDEAIAAPKEIRSRLVMKARKIGCWVDGI